MTETAIGQIIADRFRVDGRLGQGGYGDVYRARQLSVDRDVAIKLVHAHLEGREDVRARFEREARLASRVRHPNVVQVIDFGEHDGRLFLAMQYIPGDTLKARLRAGPATLREAAEWIDGIAAGLAAAHREGVVHRDLKPGNVILTPTPQGLQPVVIDFGLVKAFEEADGHDDVTHSNMLVGTPTYMSPEVVLGHPLDAKSDLYSLGVLAYVLITGQKPVQGATAIETASLHLRGDIPDVREQRMDCPPALAALVAELLERDPEQRPSDADTVAARARAVADALVEPGVSDDRTLLPTVGPAASGNRDVRRRVAPDTRETETLTRGGATAQPETDTVPIPPADDARVPEASPRSPNEPRHRRRRSQVAALLAVGVTLLIAAAAWRSVATDRDGSSDAPRAFVAESDLSPHGEPNAVNTTASRNGAAHALEAPPTQDVSTDEPPDAIADDETRAAASRGLASEANSRNEQGSAPAAGPEQPLLPVAAAAVAADGAADGTTSRREDRRNTASGQTSTTSGQTSTTSERPAPAGEERDGEGSRRTAEESSSPLPPQTAAAPADRGQDEQPEPRRESTRAERTGFLTMSPRPYGEIFVDGTSLGRTALERHPLRPGEYTIEVRYLDQVQRETVRIRAGETARPRFLFEVE